LNNRIENLNIRYNILKTIIIIIGLILLSQLFNLQIIHGKEYSKTSNTRLTRETTIDAARGNITDRNGIILAGTKMGFNVKLYRTKITTEALNTCILNTINILEKNDDKYIDNFPIRIEPFEHKFLNDEKFIDWKKANNLDESLTPEECFYEFREKYDIINEEIHEIAKIIAVRYEISQNGYSATKPILIAEDISRESAIEISEPKEDMGGISISTEAIRNYTSGSLASHVVGYIGKVTEDDIKKDDSYDANDYIGRSGVENLFEELIRGKDGIKQIDMDIDGKITDEYILEEAISGCDITLTIDAQLQNIAENAVRDNIEKIKSGGFSKKYDAKGGAVVVMNVKNGEILALVSYPDYEPELFINGISTAKWNEYNGEETKALYNRAVQGSYAPGSTFKMISAIAGLETGSITRDEKILTKGKYPLAHQPVCWIYTDYGTSHGLIDVAEAIKYSCNYFFYEVGNRMGIDALEKYARYFGLGEKTGVELYGETSGLLATRENLEKTGEKWSLGNTLSAVIGQGQNSFSPIQMARYISILTNGGKSIEPTIIKDIKDAEGTLLIREQINEYVDEKLNRTRNEKEDLKIDEQNLRKVLEGMKGVTTEADGTAYGAFKDLSIEIGGKTGSAEAGNYTNGWFVGFAPYDNPEIAIIVLIENANKGSYTAEVARKIIDQYFGFNKESVDEDIVAVPYTEIEV